MAGIFSGIGTLLNNPFVQWLQNRRIGKAQAEQQDQARAENIQAANQAGSLYGLPPTPGTGTLPEGSPTGYQQYNFSGLGYDPFQSAQGYGPGAGGGGLGPAYGGQGFGGFDPRFGGGGNVGIGRGISRAQQFSPGGGGFGQPQQGAPGGLGYGGGGGLPPGAQPQPDGTFLIQNPNTGITGAGGGVIRVDASGNPVAPNISNGPPGANPFGQPQGAGGGGGGGGRGVYGTGGLTQFGGPGGGYGGGGGQFDPRAVAANPQGFQQFQQGAQAQELARPGSTYLGQGGGGFPGQPQGGQGGLPPAYLKAAQAQEDIQPGSTFLSQGGGGGLGYGNPTGALAGPGGQPPGGGGLLGSVIPGSQQLAAAGLQTNQYFNPQAATQRYNQALGPISQGYNQLGQNLAGQGQNIIGAAAGRVGAGQQGYQNLIGGLQGRQSQALGYLQGQGAQEREDINQQFNEAQARYGQQLQASGFAGSTVGAPGIGSIERARSGALGASGERFNQQTLNTFLGTSGDIFGAQQAGIGFGAGLSGDYLNTLAGQQQFGGNYGLAALGAQGNIAAGGLGYANAAGLQGAQNLYQFGQVPLQYQMDVVGQAAQVPQNINRPYPPPPQYLGY